MFPPGARSRRAGSPRAGDQAESPGWTQLQLPSKLGVTPVTAYNWERGQHEPKACQLRTLARAFGVSMDDIDFGGQATGADAADPAAPRGRPRHDRRDREGAPPCQNPPRPTPSAAAPGRPST